MNPKHWTYGIEHEFGDWDTREGWDGFKRDPEPNICNSNGIATDPTLKSYPFGGEINTPATKDAVGQAELLEKFMLMHPRAIATHRAGLHVHIRIPGLQRHLPSLKRLQRYINANTDVYPLVDPLPLPESTEGEAYKESKKRQHWMRMSHWTSVPDYRVAMQLKAKTVQEFFELEVPKSKTGKVLWHAQARSAVSLRQLLQTDTIEFRHYSASVVPEETITAVEWCKTYLEAAFDNYPAIELFKENFADREFPKTEPFVCWRELRWRATSITKNKRDVMEKNIGLILRGKFDKVSNRGMEHLIP